MNFRKAFEKHGYGTQRKLARTAGVNEAVVNKLYHGTQSVNFISLIKIAKALGINTSELIREAEKGSE